MLLLGHGSPRHQAPAPSLVLMLAPEEGWNSAVAESAERWPLLRTHAPQLSATPLWDLTWSDCHFVEELLWFLNGSTYAIIPLTVDRGIYIEGKKCHKLTGLAMVTSYYSTTLEFRELFRTTHSFTNVSTAWLGAYTPVALGR